MKRILLLVLLASSFAGFSQTSDFPIGARSAGMANASVALTDLWAIHHNQAAMVGLEQAGVAAYYENRFLLSNLNLQGATAVLPTPKAGVLASATLDLEINFSIKVAMDLPTESAFGNFFQLDCNSVI